MRVGRWRGVGRSSALVEFAGCDGDAAPAPTEVGPVRPVRPVTVEETSGGQAVSLTCTIESQTLVNLAFRFGGRITPRPVDVADAAAPGRLLARLDPAVLPGATLDEMTIYGDPDGAFPPDAVGAPPRPPEAA